MLLFAVGLIWKEHVSRRRAEGGRPNRRSGTALLWLLPVMAASGYLLQVSVDPRWRTAWIVVHVGSSILWLGGYAAHAVVAWRRRRSERAAGDASRKHWVDTLARQLPEE